MHKDNLKCTPALLQTLCALTSKAGKTTCRNKGSNHRRLKSGGANLLLRLRQPTLNFQQVLEEGRVAISKHFCGFRRPVVGIRQPVVGIRQPVVGIHRPVVGIHQPVVGIRLTAAELRSCVYIQLSVSNFGFSDKL